MSRISRATSRAISCPNCSHSWTVAEWTVIDCRERPDLVESLGRREILQHSCPRCASLTSREQPLLVVDLATRAPVIIGVSLAALETPGWPRTFDPVVNEVRTALGDRLRDMPGPVLRVPFEILPIAATRDVDADLVAQVDEDDFLPEQHHIHNYLAFLRDIRESDPQRRRGLAMNHLHAAESFEEMKDAVAEFPELRSAELLEDVSAVVATATDDEDRAFRENFRQLVVDLRHRSLTVAWRRYREGLSQIFELHLRPRVEELEGSLRDAMAEGDLEVIVESGMELIELTRIMSIPPIEAWASYNVANALLAMPGAQRAHRVEQSVDLYRRSLEIYKEHPDLDTSSLRAELLINLGAAYGQRVRHDSSANRERSISCNREALELLSLEENGEGWAMANTNLALALIDKGEFELAVHHLKEALRWRTYERDPLDWAYTQLNLGLAYTRQQSPDNDRVHTSLAITHYEEAARGFAAAGNALGHAQALHNLAGQRFGLAEHAPSDVDRRQQLEQAETAARESVALRPLEIAPDDAGRTLSLLARILESLGRSAEAFSLCERTLPHLSPSEVPIACKEVARTLAVLADKAEKWETAALAWQRAAEASLTLIETRASSSGRFEELKNSLNVFRWAGAALARAGRVVDAVEILEVGRARELSISMQDDVIDLEQLEFLDPDLRDQFLETRSQLEQVVRGDGTGDATAAGDRAEALAGVVDQIRALPGMDRFLARPTLADIASAVTEDVPLAYLLTSPRGAMTLLVRKAPGDAPTVELIETEGVTSTEIAALMFSERGYFAAQRDENLSFKDVFEKLSASLGVHLLQPLAERLGEIHARGVCLVPVSVLGLLPLGSLQWRTSPNQDRSLLDDFEVTFAPSAAVRSVCLRRARMTRPSTKLLVVGNPLPQRVPLQGAELEAEMVANLVPADRQIVLLREHATKDALMAEMPGSDLLHLACHGWSDVLSPALTASFSLANNEMLSASEILEIDNFRPRLVVASACDSGVIQGYETADEVLGLSTAFIARGATGVIATLWSIDDYVTSLLMNRFYELLCLRPLEEVEAASCLRVAQLWLRDLTEEAENDYLRNHPTLRAHRMHSRQRGNIVSRGNTPYSSPELWAPFAFTGA
jgi:CHAT domain-containing protein/tetratricopeptide (TPR) repeat protein